MTYTLARLLCGLEKVAWYIAIFAHPSCISSVPCMGHIPPSFVHLRYGKPIAALKSQIIVVLCVIIEQRNSYNRINK